MKYLLILSLGFIFLSACNNQKNNHIILWVNSFKIDCEGAGNMKCVQIIESDSLSNDWKVLYSKIQEFNHVQGYIYKLSVEKIINIEEIKPMDKSSIQYKLVEIIEKYPDPVSRLHDIWALNESIPVNIIHPYIELNLNTKRLMGIDGCNNFMGNIKNIDSEILEFGPIAGTKKMCIDMSIPDRMSSNLSLVRKYSIVENELVLKNDIGENLLFFKKVD